MGVISHARILCALAAPRCKRDAREKFDTDEPRWHSDHRKRKEDSIVQITGLQQFLDILTVPDNIPIMAMLILVMFFTYVALRQARRNDQLIEHGHRERIIEEMRK